MKRTLINRSLLLIAALILGNAAVFAQEETPQTTPDANKPVRRVRMLQELGLTREQIQQIQRINVQRGPLMQSAQTKLRLANRALDLAIYSETVSEDEIREKMKAVQLAQAEQIKVRTFTEYQIRRVLTPEQLEKFRQLRERMMNRQDSKRDMRTRPAERLRDRNATPEN